MSAAPTSPSVAPPIGAAPAFATELVRLGARPATKDEAIRQACQLLVAAGCVDPGYADSMVAREAVANTFLGNGVAIPHGLVEDRGFVRRDAVAVLQVPAGVLWNPGQEARLVVAIAARGDGHLAILRRLTRLIGDEARLAALATTTDAGLIAAALAEDAPAAPTGPAARDLDATLAWTCDYPTGLHARPASAWVEAARRSGVRLQVRHGDAAADPRNLVGLLQLGIRSGDPLVLSAAGPDAPAALDAFRAVVAGLSAGEKRDAARAAEKAAAPVRGWSPPSRLRAVAGLGASPGLAIGRVHVVTAEAPAVPDRPEPLLAAGDRLHEALSATRQALAALVDDTTRRLGVGDAAIFRAQGELLADTDLVTLACQIMVEGHGVAWSWHEAVERKATELAALGNPVLAGRAADLRDVGWRVLGQLDPALARTSLAGLPDEPCIVLTRDLSPSDTAALDMDRVIGLATAEGGPTSHTAILARTLGLPALVAGGADLLGIPSGTLVVLDGGTGRLHVDPGEADLASARAFVEEADRVRREEEAQRSLPAETRDGHAVQIGANVNRPDQVPLAIAQGGEGVGLMRTEFLFLERGDTPSEDEQYAIYRAMIDGLEGRPLIVRALDIGGDKQVAHLNLPHEDNPFLGVRGARLLLRRPDLLEPQLRALYRAARDGGELLVMFPMITSVAEVTALRAACDRVREGLDAPAVPIGIMIEVPAAAVAADRLAPHVDFFSVGTNDLTQYVLAMDRQNPVLAPEADSLHPAVLRLIRQTVEGATAHGRWVGVCGGLAGDPFGATLLAGLGVAELSMTPRDIPAVKARIRGAAIADLRDLAARALDCDSAEEVRALDTAR